MLTQTLAIYGMYLISAHEVFTVESRFFSGHKMCTFEVKNYQKKKKKKKKKKLVIAFQLMLRLLHGKYIWELRISHMEA